MKHIEQIVAYLQNIHRLNQVASVLSWDQETMMPSGAIQARADQCADISGLIHERWTSDEFMTNISTCIDIDSGVPKLSLSSEEVAFMRELYPIWKRQSKLSKQFIQRLTSATSIAQHEWQKARQNNDFGLFSNHLKTIVDLQREKVDVLGYQGHPYDCLLDEYEPGMTVSVLDDLFSDLKKILIPFIDKRKVTKKIELIGNFDRQQQMQYSHRLASLLGFDFEFGRLDVSAHPFTVDIHPQDVRITTRVSESNFLEAFSSTIHEVGHALYEQGLDHQWAGTPFGMARSMAIHESQSRLWEVFICQSMPFWQGQIDDLNSQFPDMVKYSAEDLYMITHQVFPHWCRVESDVITYNLHIILRYECEKALITGELSVDDLPQFWNQKMKDYLGITIESDAHGCLQDVHWSAGLFGYFPSYTLGTVVASQLYKRLNDKFSDLSLQIKSAKFTNITKWLNNHIHYYGCQLTTDELLRSLDISYNIDEFICILNEIF